MNKDLPTILVVDDEEDWRTTVRLCLWKVATVLVAANLEEAKGYIPAVTDLKLIAVDGLNGDGASIVEFAKARKFDGPIVAMSGDYDRMIAAGATHRLKGPKHEIVELLKKLVAKFSQGGRKNAGTQK